MDTLIINKINDRLKNTPNAFADEILEYIDSINMKSSFNNDLSDNEVDLILKGIDDIKNGRTYTHTQAKSIIAKHIQDKVK